MTIGKGTVIRDSIIMQGVTIGENCVIDKAIIAEDTVIGDEVSIGIGSEAPNKLKPNIYSGGLATIGEKSVIPSGVQIGKIQPSAVLHQRRIMLAEYLRAERH